MDSEDVIELQDLARVRVQVAAWRHRALAVSASVSIIAGLLAGVLFYYFKLANMGASTFVGTIFFSLGLYYFVGWWRHYRAIFSQLDDLERRVRTGEIILGAQVAFASYR
jgi:hypothetical protein